MQNTHLLPAGWQIVRRHKRYLFWFWVLNLTLAEFGAAAYRARLHRALDRSLLADRLVHGFDLMVYQEMISRPEWGSFMGAALPAAYFAWLFFLVTLLLLPGVLEGYTSEGKLSREEFFRICGRNLWRFIRLLLLFTIVAVPVLAGLWGGRSALVKAAGESTNEKLPFFTQLVALVVIFLVMAGIRVWFDLAQVDVVVRDQNTVRKSVVTGFRYARHNVFQLIGAYAAIFLIGLVILMVGIWCWHALVRPSSVLGAFVVGQIIAVLWLGTRFWQRATAAAFYLREVSVPSPPPRPPEFPATPVAGSLEVSRLAGGEGSS
jgi:hypothetical protein